MKGLAIEIVVVSLLLLLLFFLNKYGIISEGIYYGLSGGVFGGWIAEKTTKYFKTRKNR